MLIFCFYNEEEFVGFAFSIYNQKAFMLASLPLCPTYVDTVMVKKSLKIGEFYQRTMILEVERLDENVTI